jgi:hypothetical protein
MIVNRGFAFVSASIIGVSCVKSVPLTLTEKADRIEEMDLHPLTLSLGLNPV